MMDFYLMAVIGRLTELEKRLDALAVRVEELEGKQQKPVKKKKQTDA